MQYKKQCVYVLRSTCFFFFTFEATRSFRLKSRTTSPVFNHCLLKVFLYELICRALGVLRHTGIVMEMFAVVAMFCALFWRHSVVNLAQNGLQMLGKTHANFWGLAIGLVFHLPLTPTAPVTLPNAMSPSADSTVRIRRHPPPLRPACDRPHAEYGPQCIPISREHRVLRGSDTHTDTRAHSISAAGGCDVY